MALEVTGMTRSFTFKKGSGMVMLDDPNPSDSPEMVMSYYSNFYPELTTATVHGPVIKDDKAVYEFKTTIGTKEPPGPLPERRKVSPDSSAARKPYRCRLLQPGKPYRIRN